MSSGSESTRFKPGRVVARSPTHDRVRSIAPHLITARVRGVRLKTLHALLLKNGVNVPYASLERILNKFKKDHRIIRRHDGSLEMTNCKKHVQVASAPDDLLIKIELLTPEFVIFDNEYDAY